MDIPMVKAHRARLLYAAGLRTAEAVASSSEATIMSILAKGGCTVLGHEQRLFVLILLYIC